MTQPLADRMRPTTLEEYVGQGHVVGQASLLRRIIEQDRLPSMIFWGPPGSGKTTLARIIAAMTKAEFRQLSAIDSGVKEIRSIVEEAQAMQRLGTRTLLFIDEIHRYNKSQQDALLPHVEKGTMTLIGATTENPSFALNAALLSRCRVFVLEMLDIDDLRVIAQRALSDEGRGLGALRARVEDDALDFLLHTAQGDARSVLNVLELAVTGTSPTTDGERVVTLEIIKDAVARSHVIFDKGGEEFYNVISALHKSMRGGDADAALYWLGRMLEGGADPLYIARRLIRFASEDVGIANSFALPQAVAGYQACQFIGMPECAVNLAQVVVYLAQSKKSNALYTGYNQVRRDIHELPNEGVPLHLRNAPTKLMKDLGYGKEYKYTPDYETPDEAAQDYLPESLKDRRYLNL